MGITEGTLTAGEGASLEQAYLRLERYEPAVEAYEAALAADPRSAFRGEALVGLGLALCRQILSRYGGTIVLEPTVADEGPSFRMEIPQA